jgi:hypothetical protein
VSEEAEAQALKTQSAKTGPKAPKEGLDRYLGASLWMSLSDEASVSAIIDLCTQERSVEWGFRLTNSDPWHA